MSDSLWPYGLYSPWNSPGQNTGVGSLSLLQGIFPTQRANPGLLHCGRILYKLSHKGSPRILEWVTIPFSGGSSWPRNRTRVSCSAGRFFINWANREAPKWKWKSLSCVVSLRPHGLYSSLNFPGLVYRLITRWKCYSATELTLGIWPQEKEWNPVLTTWPLPRASRGPRLTPTPPSFQLPSSRWAAALFCFPLSSSSSLLVFWIITSSYFYIDGRGVNWVLMYPKQTWSSLWTWLRELRASPTFHTIFS